MSSPPIVRPVRDILGDNVAPLRIIEPPKANGGRVTDGSLRTQVRSLLSEGWHGRLPAKPRTLKFEFLTG